MSTQGRADEIFALCFTSEELVFLRGQPRFAEATRNINSLTETLDAVEIGEQIIRETWRKDRGDSEFTPKNLQDSN